MESNQKQATLQEQKDYLGSLEVNISAQNAKDKIAEYLHDPIAHIQSEDALKVMVLINNLPVFLLKTGDGPCDINILYVNELGENVLCDPEVDASEQIYDYLRSVGELIGQYKGYSIHKIQEEGLTTAIFKLRKEGAKEVNLTLDVSQEAAEILTTITDMVDRILRGA